MNRRIACALGFALVALLFVQCKRSTAGRVSPRTGLPVVHRAAAPVCLQARASDPEGAPSGTVCHDDADCKQGVNGRCTHRYGGMGTRSNQCTYDECSRDADCGPGRACDCRTEPGEWRASTCVAATCRTDADCESSFCGRSSPPSLGTGPGWLTGWACHSASDKCTEDSECATSSPSACAYRPNVRRFECATGGAD